MPTGFSFVQWCSRGALNALGDVWTVHVACTVLGAVGAGDPAMAF
jgi:hypothetical protein